MYVIVGLGNPGTKYEKTRHNVGFDVIDLLAEKNGISVTEKKHKALIGKGHVADQAVILVKPQTFMNLSGESVSDILNFYKLDAEDALIVVSDDVMLAPGVIRVRRKGSDGGHNGLKNIIHHLHTDGFQRIRVGVGALAADRDMISHVLGRFLPDDRRLVELSYENAVGAIECMVCGDIERAMNLYNGKVEA